VLVVHALTMFVYFFLFTSAALERMDWDLLLAARSLGASPRRVRNVVLRCSARRCSGPPR
jgi:ABC-type Fe3+ transport system permease subunit